MKGPGYLAYAIADLDAGERQLLSRKSEFTSLIRSRGKKAGYRMGQVQTVRYVKFCRETPIPVPPPLATEVSFALVADSFVYRAEKAVFCLRRRQIQCDWFHDVQTGESPLTFPSGMFYSWSSGSSLKVWAVAEEDLQHLFLQFWLTYFPLQVIASLPTTPEANP